MRMELKAKLFRGLGDPSRLAVLEALRPGARCVSDLMQVTRLSQPNLSMHLACLRACGLVRARRNGRFVYYELTDPTVVQWLRQAEQVLRSVARRIEACRRYESPTNPNGKLSRAKRQLRLRRR